MADLKAILSIIALACNISRWVFSKKLDSPLFFPIEIFWIGGFCFIGDRAPAGEAFKILSWAGIIR